MGAPKWPPNPQPSERPGEAVPLLETAPAHWGPEMAPKPQPSERPGEAVPLLETAPAHWGPEMAPTPPAFGASRRSRAAPRGPRQPIGAPKWPPHPQPSERPGDAVPPLETPPAPSRPPNGPH